MPRPDWPDDARELVARLERRIQEQHAEIKRLRGQVMEAEANMRAAIRASVRKDCGR